MNLLLGELFPAIFNPYNFWLPMVELDFCVYVAVIGNSRPEINDALFHVSLLVGFHKRS